MGDVAIFLLYLALAAAWILVPLLPAWITYRITPGQTLGLSGPFKGLTLNTSGAFAAYLIVLWVAQVAFDRGSELVGALARPVWTLEANLVVKDKNGTEQRLPSGPSPVRVIFTPDIHSISTNQVHLKLPGHMTEWPLVLFDIPGYGGKTLVFKQMQGEMDIDHFQKTILLRTPIEIREGPVANFRVGKSLDQN